MGEDDPTLPGDAAPGAFGGEHPFAAGTEAARVSAIFAAVGGLIAEARAGEWWRIPEPDLMLLARHWESVLRAGSGIRLRLAGELVDRGTAGTLGFRTPANLLHDTLNLTMPAARGLVAVAEAALPHETPAGDPIDPALPELLEALDDGQVSEAHAAVIVATMRRIPSNIDREVRATCRDILIQQACLVDVSKLQQIAEQVCLIVDEDGTFDGRDPVDRAELHIGSRRRDGLTPIRGLLDPLAAEALRQAIEPLAAPRPVDDKTPDPRSAPVRRAQALGELCARYLSCGRSPLDGGVRPQVVVTVELDRLIEALGPAWADYTGVHSAATARLLACDAELIPQVLGSGSEVLDQGRAVRLFPPEIRRAIATRDRGCAFPACDSPAGWCEAHHIDWWKRDLGPTSERNGVLLCRRHHVVIHQGRWEIRMPDQGKPDFIPPPELDPARTPRRNAQWDLPTITLPPPANAGARRRRMPLLRT